MKNLLLPVALLLLAGAAQAQAEEVCPVLPAGAGLTWRHLQGPDFDVCYAVDAESEEDVFGIYLGFHPAVQLGVDHRSEKGVVGTHEVTWHRTTGSTSSAYARETLITLGEHGYQAHVWVSAATVQEEKETLSLLEQIRFR
jgi:hypothetical protein